MMAITGQITLKYHAGDSGAYCTCMWAVRIVLDGRVNAEKRIGGGLFLLAWLPQLPWPAESHPHTSAAVRQILLCTDHKLTRTFSSANG